MRLRCTVVPPVSRDTSRIGVGVAASSGDPGHPGHLEEGVHRPVERRSVTDRRRSAAARETICPIAREAANGASGAQARPLRTTPAPVGSSPTAGRSSIFPSAALSRRKSRRAANRSGSIAASSSNTQAKSRPSSTIRRQAARWLRNAPISGRPSANG